MTADDNAHPGLLIVDDDALIQETLAFVLGEHFSIRQAASREEATALLRDTHYEPQLALVDLGLPPYPHRADEGLLLIREILAIAPLCKIVVLSGQDEEAHARHARTLGALEFVTKPVSPASLHSILAHALHVRQQELIERADTWPDHRIVGLSPAMQAVRERIGQYARSRFPILIEGQSGTGKEIAARALHAHGDTAGKPFLALNCSAISPGLIEATLFGHVRGAYTGAVTAQNGYFQDAGEGCLFLDEIGELPLDVQPKLLRVLESGEYQRVGETQPRFSKARILAATNRDLLVEVRAGRFRVDLYHRLSVLRILMPPLRDMASDRDVLLLHFLHEFSVQMALPTFRFDDDALAMWHRYTFPGNVRELRNIVARLLSRFAGQTVSAEDLALELEEPVMPETKAETAVPVPLPAMDHRGISLDATLRQVERHYIMAALLQAQGNLSHAARLLGLNRSTLYNRIDTLARNGEAIPDFMTLAREHS
ncbi:MAG: sigma-54-dependent Fis family transcriptional regulator [Uliginosibacterium sp.]|nr:sigma-54-dependent Fis family transcriptional regulator [Uliginosibacterium sp.]